MVELENGHICKNLTQNGEPQRYSWGMQKKKKIFGMTDSRRRSSNFGGYILKNLTLVLVTIGEQLIFFKCILITTKITLIFIQGHQGTRKRKLLFSFSCKVPNHLDEI